MRTIYVLVFVLSCYQRNGHGFPVTEGWDPVTGFGTPNYPEMVKAFTFSKDVIEVVV